MVMGKIDEDGDGDGEIFMGMGWGWGKFYRDGVGMGLIFLPCHSLVLTTVTVGYPMALQQKVKQGNAKHDTPPMPLQTNRYCERYSTNTVHHSKH